MDNYQPLTLPEGATASLSYDVLRKCGLSPTAIGSPLEPIDRYAPFIGRAFTVRGKADPTLTPDESLMEWTKMLSKTPAHAVLVIEPGDCDRAYMGELSAHALTYRHCAGSVVDGPCRDTNQIRSLGFPVFCKGVTPQDVVAAWRPVEFGGAVRVNGAVITSDDIIIGDSDGLCVTHRDNTSTLMQKLNEALTAENKVREAILAGDDPHDAYLRYRKF